MPDDLNAAVVLGQNVDVWIFFFEGFFERGEGLDQAPGGEYDQGRFWDRTHLGLCSVTGSESQGEGEQKKGAEEFGHGYSMSLRVCVLCERSNLRLIGESSREEFAH
jgi:hypothetical protein